MSFFDFLFPPRADEKVLREVSADDFLALLSSQLVPDTRPGTTALLPFSDPRVRAAIHEAKYHGSARAFEFLAAVLTDYLHDVDEGKRRTRFVLVPVPLGKERLRERGFNQVEEAVRGALRILDGRFTLDTNLLERVKETQSQVSLERRKREENMRGSFGVMSAVDPLCTYLIVDDVITTGATLQAAIDALIEAGATHVIPLALAH